MDGDASGGGSGGVMALLRALLDNWAHFILLGIVLAGMAGVLAKGAGLSNIFRDDARLIAARRTHSQAQVLWSSPAFWTHAALVLVAGLIWVIVLERPAPTGQAAPAPIWPPDGAGAGTLLFFAFAAAVGGLGLYLSWKDASHDRVDGETPPPEEVSAEMLRASIGLVTGLLLLGLLWLAAWQSTGWTRWVLHVFGSDLPANVVGVVSAEQGERLRAALDGWVSNNWTPRIVLFGLAAMVLLVIPLASPKVLACLSLMGLIAGVAMVMGLFDRIQSGLAEAVAFAVLLVVVAFNGMPFKLRIPGFPDALYDAPIDPNGEPDAKVEVKGHPGAIKPVDALGAWAARRGGLPRLVLLCTSGGAYRASFWTALLLDRLAEEASAGERFEGMMEDIRLVTGASGGMVAGAYFTAMRAEGTVMGGIRRRIEDDIEDFQLSAAGGRRGIPIPRDSLTPIAQRLVRRDLGQILSPNRAADDRGRVLDRQWATLHTTFAEIAPSEAAGVAPSFILSPMLIESGAPAFITNLDLEPLRNRARLREEDDVNAESVELFAAFPDAWDKLTLATGVRLNATFPYVSPAISLPTLPQRRVVDAGYYDNYGVDLANAFLLTPSIRDWIMANCSGVAVIQARAFPSGGADKPKGAAARAFQWVTSPAEGVFSARGSSQMFRNNQQMRLAESIYAERKAPGFLRSFVFEADVEASMSWYLPEDEIRAMVRLLPQPETAIGPVEPARAKAAARERTGAIREELDHLADFWAGLPDRRAPLPE